ncbi:DUF2239 family protein [Burkholderia glumae]|uniref:DUF2239 family protein n=2 Tax=Burkholderia glumae TaxID=337 RepID=UPI000F5E7CCA|nr:DUF2239 family protein [Burkholderia glumae]MCQ0032881.1 DUF2239 family protein [Burkholderia glumae]QJW80373.1 DUF2239 family protein [Burkholderia glumae]RQZ70840.1 DUF2239 family protein [Burkholderia glumae]UVS84360.1 DUF2239 family protein [Burkholderia glumae]
MSDTVSLPRYSGFEGVTHLASGDLATVALAIRQAARAADARTVLLFDNATGRAIDVDLRGSDDEILARLAAAAGTGAAAPDPDAGGEAAAEGPPAGGAPRGRGRPRLGVVAREVTLLPRHWDWLASQPGGASVVLRKLVDEARRVSGERDRRRAAHARAYHFMSALAGDLPGFEEAARALFADDAAGLRQRIAGWPADVQAHLLRLAQPGPAEA